MNDTVWAGAVLAMLAAAPCSADELVLKVGQPAQAVGSALSLRATNIVDDRCRADAKRGYGGSDCANQRAYAELAVREGAANYDVGPLLTGPGPNMGRHAKVGAWFIELTAITPPGRTLVTDRGPRDYAAHVHVERADRVLARAGQPAQLPQSGAQVELTEVLDQRCPRGVMCGTAGRLLVVLTLSRPGVAPERVALERLATRWQGVDLQLCSVEPRPAAGVKLEDYRLDVFAMPTRPSIDMDDFAREPCRGGV